MSVNRSGEMATLRAAALTAVLASASGSLSLMLRAGRHNGSRLLLLLMAIWVGFPFVGMIFVYLVSKRWRRPTRATLYWLMLLISLGSLAIYIDDALSPPKPKAAVVFVAVPPASWLLIAIVLPLAVFLSSKRSQGPQQKDD